MKKMILIATFLVAQFAMAQEDALVFFTDKENVATSIANPISIMTQEAIDRKTMHNTPIDERDVPLNEAYKTMINDTPGIDVFAKSKWMNAVYVRGSQADIENLENLSFVDSVEFMDKSLNAWSGNNHHDDKFAMENEQTRIVYDYGAALNQTEMIAADKLHESDYIGEGMIVAVMDSGFPNVMSNPAFSDIVSEGRLLDTYDFAERQVNVDGTGSHGARTFSDIGGFLDGDFVGTAPGASFYLYRTEYGPTENPVEEAWWVEALERADSLGVDVVNTSLGYQDYDNPSYDHSYQDLDGQTTIGARGANHAFDKGMILVTSAGNDGGGFTFVATPGDSPGMLTVGAVDSNGDYAFFSSIGPTVDGRIKPDVMAQGQGAAIVTQNGNVDFNNGTSFSSPIMAGAVASLWQARPEVPNHVIMDIVRESAHLFDNPTDEMGYGIPNFEDALLALEVLGVQDEFLDTQFAIYPNPAADVVNVSFPDNATNVEAILYDVFGKLITKSKLSTLNKTIDISDLSQGMYLLSVRSENKTNSFKVLKK